MDIMNVTVIPEVTAPDSSNLIITGSCDTTAKLWDTRQATAAQTYSWHEADINTVQWFPNNMCFGTGSDDGSCCLFDIRIPDQPLMQYFDDTTLTPVNSLAFSTVSGRYMFSSYSMVSECLVWDTLTGKKVKSLEGHISDISSLGVNHDSTALATSSWDGFVKLWSS